MATPISPGYSAGPQMTFPKTITFPEPREVHFLDDSEVNDEGEEDENDNEDDEADPDFDNELKVSPKKRITYSESINWRPAYKAIRFFLCLFFFLFILGSATLSKLCLLLLTSNINVGKHFNFTSSDNNGKPVTYILKQGNTVTDVEWIWALLLVICVPYLFTAMSCIWVIIFKGEKSLKLSPLLVSLVTESLHTCGLVVFAFFVMPSYDPLAGCFLTLSVAVIPGILQSFETDPRKRAAVDCQSVTRRIMDIVMIGIHISVVVIWSYKAYGEKNRDILLTTLLPVSLVLTSISWWENFVPTIKKREATFANVLSRMKRSIYVRRHKIALITSLWKILFTIGLTAVLFSVGNNSCFQTFLTRDPYATGCSVFGNLTLSHLRPRNRDLLDCIDHLPFLVAAVFIVSSAFCYKIAKYSCKILSEVKSVSVPLCLSLPISLSIITITYMYPQNTDNIFGCHLPWMRESNIETLDISEFFLAYTRRLWIPVGFLSFMSIIGIAKHIWTPNNKRMAKTHMLYLKNLYCGILLDASLMLNRRRDDQMKMGSRRNRYLRLSQSGFRSGSVPHIHICATMWQENVNEMTQMLKSIFRLDNDHSARRNAIDFFDIDDRDYYEFDAHIFFDNAFGNQKRSEMLAYTVNEHVVKLCNAMDIAASAIHNTVVKLPPPARYPTPYGGRLVYTMPGKNTITVHLKDSSKVRRKKRWSQVMYMYYFLKHKILDNDEINERKKKKKSENTFLLALDGDVDFQPDALRILVDRMQVDPTLGAACGRIHPIGSGPMVWYQKFEYAVSHWLQKATENMLGCVLCSPGCFSLFRGSALMDDNVMKKYATPSSEARHHVQYDQGEDRWLCTLLLQQGHRVEYCAASDSYTFAPEGFFEFFKQRRRWTPSTMANILDLIMSWKQTISKNPDVSILYIVYQMGLFTSSVVTPGTILLLVVGALDNAFENFTLYWSLALNLLILFAFLLICFKGSSKLQLKSAFYLSIFYCLLMMVVLVGIIKKAADGGFCSVSTMFLIGVAGIFTISGLVHPQELTCLIHGVLYFLTIPCMSMLMVIYSLANLNDVSWGTRENPTSFQQVGFVKGTMLGRFLSRLLPARSQEHALTQEAQSPSQSHTVNDQGDIENPGIQEDNSQHSTIATWQSARTSTTDTAVDSLYWTMDEAIGGNGNQFRKEIDSKERKFWRNVISKHLTPILQDDDEKERVKQELLLLRNKVCLGFILINSLFIILVLFLEIVAEKTKNLAIEIRCDSESFTAERLQPITFAFTAVFGILLSLQFLAMLFHRFSTFLQIAAGTEIKLFSFRFKEGQKKYYQENPEAAIELAMRFQSLSEEHNPGDDTASLATSDGESELDDFDEQRRQKPSSLWSKLQKHVNRSIEEEDNQNTLGGRFLKNMEKLAQATANNETETELQNDVEQQFKSYKIDFKSIVDIAWKARRDATHEDPSVEISTSSPENPSTSKSERKNLSDVVKVMMQRKRRGTESTAFQRVLNNTLNDESLNNRNHRRNGTQNSHKEVVDNRPVDQHDQNQETRPSGNLVVAGNIDIGRDLSKPLDSSPLDQRASSTVSTGRSVVEQETYESFSKAIQTQFPEEGDTDTDEDDNLPMEQSRRTREVIMAPRRERRERERVPAPVQYHTPNIGKGDWPKE